MENLPARKSLYQMTQEMADLFNSDEEVTEEQLTKVFGDIQHKAENTCFFLSDISADIALIETHEKRLKARKDVLKNLHERVKGYIKAAMLALEMATLKSGTFTLSLANTPGRLVISQTATIPSKYCIIIPESHVADKAAITAALKSGEIVDGYEIVKDKSLRIR